MGKPPEAITSRHANRVDTGQLSQNVRRYLLTHILDELRHWNWKKHTRSAGLLANGRSGARVTGSALSDGWLTQRYTELIDEFLVCTVLPEDDLAMDRLEVYGITLSREMLAQFQRDLTMEPGHADLHFSHVLNQLETGVVRRVWNIKRPQPENHMPHATYYRNPRTTELGAITTERLLNYCDVVKAPQVVAERLLDDLDEMTAELISPTLVAALA